MKLWHGIELPTGTFPVWDEGVQRQIGTGRISRVTADRVEATIAYDPEWVHLAGEDSQQGAPVTIMTREVSGYMRDVVEYTRLELRDPMGILTRSWSRACCRRRWGSWLRRMA